MSTRRYCTKADQEKDLEEAKKILKLMNAKGFEIDIIDGACYIKILNPEYFNKSATEAIKLNEQPWLAIHLELLIVAAHIDEL